MFCISYGFSYLVFSVATTETTAGLVSERVITEIESKGNACFEAWKLHPGNWESALVVTPYSTLWDLDVSIGVYLALKNCAIEAQDSSVVLVFPLANGGFEVAQENRFPVRFALDGPTVIGRNQTICFEENARDEGDSVYILKEVRK